ncbi:hypothetical protein HCN51_20345 [Nonomuraea sp. FMUSA5-5]|uniref:STAS domain-containing protein n=1 Tax=Nonomuraea composti TaxID=2720023 RepID=A0ABX1B353_9ACTN|nr:hypothetical protein [Nonomuraea sp. FMUSA5-5]NJP91781.1 hypothetical protein [Nonomuraea sp. FMUSA5-5]
MGKTSAMTDLSIDVQRLPSCHVVHLEGELDRMTQPPLAEERGGALRLIGVHGALARLLTITGLVHLFPPCRDFAQATTWAGPCGRSR